MHILKCAKQHDGTIFGDVVPLAYVRALASLIPRFGKEAEKRLTKESSLEHSVEFWLNKQRIFLCAEYLVMSVHSFTGIEDISNITFQIRLKNGSSLSLRP